MTSKLLTLTLIVTAFGISFSFPESRTSSVSSLAGSRSIYGLGHNAIGGSLIYSAPIETQSSTTEEIVTKAVTRTITDNTLRSERESSRKRSRSSRSNNNFERTKRDPAGAGVPGQRTLYHRIVGCVRNGMGLDFVQDSNARCAIGAWFRVFKIKEKVLCKNCNPLFYCMANAIVHGSCGHHHHGREAAAIISDCQELRLTSADASAEVLDEASVLGRSSGTNGCENSYLCSSGCRFSSSNDTCDATCH